MTTETLHPFHLTDRNQKRLNEVDTNYCATVAIRNAIDQLAKLLPEMGLARIAQINNEFAEILSAVNDGVSVIQEMEDWETRYESLKDAITADLNYY